jgi:hypothetical protein
MDPKGKGIVINDKEKETLNNNEPKGDKPNDSVLNNKRKDGKKKRHIKKIIYYNSDASSSSPKDDDEDDSTSKKKMVNKKLFFYYSHISYNSNAHLLSIPLGKPHTLMGKIILFEVRKYVVIYFLIILAFGK